MGGKKLAPLATPDQIEQLKALGFEPLYSTGTRQAYYLENSSDEPNIIVRLDRCGLHLISSFLDGRLMWRVEFKTTNDLFGRLKETIEEHAK